MKNDNELNMKTGGWSISEYKDMFILSGGEIDVETENDICFESENELYDKVEALLGRKISPAGRTTYRYVTKGRTYYGISRPNNNKGFWDTLVKFARNDGLDDFYVHRELNANSAGIDVLSTDTVEKFIQADDREHKNKIKLVRIGAGAVASALGMTAAVVLLRTHIFPLGLAASLFSVLVPVLIASLIAIGVISYSTYEYRVHRLETLNDLKIDEYFCKDKILYVVNPNVDLTDYEGNDGNYISDELVSTINKCIDKDPVLSGCHLRAGICESKESIPDSKYNYSKLICLTRCYTGEEEIPAGVRYTCSDVLWRLKIFNGHDLEPYRHIDDTVQELRNRTKLVDGSVSSPTLVSSQTTGEAERLYEDIKQLEHECLASNTISVKIRSKLDTLKALDNDTGISSFINQLKLVKSKLELLKNNDEGIETAMKDISAVIDIKAQLK